MEGSKFPQLSLVVLWLQMLGAKGLLEIGVQGLNTDPSVLLSIL